MSFERIEVDPAIMAGAPCVAGTRIPVATIIGMLAEGATHEDILVQYRQLEEADIRQALAFASAAVDERTRPRRSA